VSGLPGTLGNWVRRLVFFYDNLGVFITYKVIGRDLTIGFRGVRMNEAWPILEPSIRREWKIRKMGYAVFYEDLVYQFRSRSPAEVYGKLRLHRLPVDDSVGY
jgi:hypothetical protein